MNKETWEAQFDEKFVDCYYGKDSDGVPNYLPESAVQDIKDFIRSLLAQEKSAWQEQARHDIAKLKKESSRSQFFDNIDSLF